MGTRGERRTFRSSGIAPASDADGLISSSAFAKCRHRNTRVGETALSISSSSALVASAEGSRLEEAECSDRTLCFASNADMVARFDETVPVDIATGGTVGSAAAESHGSDTVSLTAARAALTQTSV